MLKSKKKTDKDKVAVLFSGGRDSSLVVALMALSGYQVYLLTNNSGVSFKPNYSGIEISDLRINELKSIFHGNIKDRIWLNTFGLFREIAISNIENDFKHYKKNLIFLGEKMAMHAEATIFCLKNNIKTLADGCVGYQNQMAEQMPVAVKIFRRFEKEYGIQYISPLLNYNSEYEVKYKLQQLGLSTKSLENTSIFADSFSTPDEKTVHQYIIDKLDYCRNYIALKVAAIKI